MQERKRAPGFFPSHLRLLLRLLGIVFVAEAAVMVLLPLLIPAELPFYANIMDSALLVILITPFLYWYIARPLRTAALTERERVASIVAHGMHGVVTADARGRVETFNPAAEQIFGYSSQEVLGKPITLLMPDRYSASFQKGLELAHATREAGLPAKPIELYGLRKDGSEFPLELSLAAWRVGAEALYTSVLRDISERKQAEEALAEQRVLLETILRQAADGILVCDAKGMITFANSAVKRLLGGKDLEGVMLDRGTDLWGTPYDHPGRVIPAEDYVTSRALRGEATVGREARLVRPDGSMRYFLVSTTPLRNPEQEVVGAVTTFADMTERKRAEEDIKRLNADLERRALELQATNKELEAFSYSVSHDLREPLCAIDGLSATLLERYAPHLGPKVLSYANLIRENVQAMERLVGDLLKFSQMSQQPLTKQSVAPADLVQDVLRDLRDKQEGRRIEIRIGNLPACQADPALLKLVFGNLLANAFKFTRQREKAVIEIGCREEDGESVYFVRDNGVGFDMRQANRLFGVFQRLHSVEEYEGTGVGLSIVQRIIHRHGGRVWADAEVDQGATFCFTLAGSA